MGYLDGSTITVDAVLTKQGRRILADPNNQGGLTPTAFILTDTGIDYNLWNPDHPSGSAYYGEVIEALPQPEALPQAEYFLRDQLVTLNKAITALPTIDLGDISDPYLFKTNNTNQPPLKISPSTLNYGNAIGRASAESSYFIVIPDTAIVDSTKGVFTEMSGVALQFINVQDIPQGGMYEYGAGDLPIELLPAGTDEKRTILVTIIGGETGAYSTLSITVPKNIVDQDVKTVPSGTGT